MQGTDGKLNDQFFIRYSFAVLKIAETSNFQQVENEVSLWIYVSDDSENEKYKLCEIKILLI